MFWIFLLFPFGPGPYIVRGILYWCSVCNFLVDVRVLSVGYIGRLWWYVQCFTRHRQPGCSILYSDQCIHGKTSAVPHGPHRPTRPVSLPFLSNRAFTSTSLNTSRLRLVLNLASWNISNPSRLACPRSSPSAKSVRSQRSAHQIQDKV